MGENKKLTIDVILEGMRSTNKAFMDAADFELLVHEWADILTSEVEGGRVAMRLALQALSRVSEVPCGHHAHAENQSGGLVYFCPWCEADVVQIDGAPSVPLQHADGCARSQAVLALNASLGVSDAPALSETR